MLAPAQTKRLAVEFERHDGFEPLHELLFGRSGLDLVQTSLPFFAICLCVPNMSYVYQIEKHYIPFLRPIIW